MTAMQGGDDSQQSSRRDPFLEDLPKVEAATLHAQTLDEAPAGVTVITRSQIRTFDEVTADAVGAFGSLTAGGQADVDLQAVEYDRQVSPRYVDLLDVNPPVWQIGVFVEDEKYVKGIWKSGR